MASNLQRNRSVSLIRQSGTGGSTSTYSRNSIAGFDHIPDKVVGNFITFADGTKFRRATSYARCHSATEPGASQNTEARVTEPLWLNNRAFERSSPGGYRLDDMYTLDYMNVLKSMGITDIRAPCPMAPSGQQNEAITKALLDIADTKANVGENLATLRQTIGLMSGPLGNLVKSLRSFHKDRALRPFARIPPRDLIRLGAPKNIASKYLEYAYGWKPLMQDIFGLSELAKESGKKPLLIRGRGKSVREPNVSWRYVNVSNEAESIMDSSNCRDRVNCTLWGRVDPEYAGTRALNRMGLLNPASLAWELVPWSFVIDWVLPIGPVLQALTAPAGLKFVDGSISRKVSVKANISHKSIFLRGNYPARKILSDAPATAVFTYDSYRRSPLGTWPTAGLWIDLDPLRGDRSWKALALAVLTLKSLR